MKIENMKKFHIQITYDPNVPCSILIPFILSSFGFMKLLRSSQRRSFFFIRIINTWIWFTFHFYCRNALLSCACSLVRFMLNISLRFENFITLRAFEEGKWHVKLMELICYPHPCPTSTPISSFESWKLNEKKVQKKIFSSDFLNFFSYLIPLQ